MAQLEHASYPPAPGRARVLAELTESLKADMPDRLVIVGGPRTGKSTLMRALERDGVTLHGSDDVQHLEWSDASAHCSKWLDDPGPFVLEGVAMARALRKWIARDEGKPCDLVLWLSEPVAERTKGQVSMDKGVATVLMEIAPVLRKRGVTMRKI